MKLPLNRILRVAKRKVFGEKETPAAVTEASGDIPDLIRLSDATGPILFGSPVILCGAMIKGKPNFNTLGNFGIVSLGKPHPIIYISSNSEHYTNIGIHEHGEFSIGIPNQEIVSRLDYCGVVSGHKKDKSGVFKVHFGVLRNAPVITECPISFTCRVTNHTVVGQMDVFFGEIHEKYALASLMNGERPDPEKIKPLTFGPGSTYRVVDAQVGIPWSEYRKVY